MKPSYFQRAASGARRNFLQTSAGLAAAALVPVPLAAVPDQAALEALSAPARAFSAFAAPSAAAANVPALRLLDDGLGSWAARRQRGSRCSDW